MFEEHSELCTRIDKCAAFLDTENRALAKDKKLTRLERQLLSAQLMSMRSYAIILNERCKLESDRKQAHNENEAKAIAAARDV